MTQLQQNLIDKGYSKWIDDKNHFMHDTNIAYQKCFRRIDPDEGYTLGKKYYLTAYYYDNADLKRNIPGVCDESLQWEVQFTLENGNVFDVTYCTTDIEKAEDFFANMFEKMECLGYE